MSTLRQLSLAVLREPDPWRKAALARALDPFDGIGADEAITRPEGIPGRPARTALVPHTEFRQRAIRSPDTKA